MDHSYICNQCNHNAHKWLGKCPQCNSWNSFISKEELCSKKKEILAVPANEDVFLEEVIERSCGIREFDRVFSNGITEGSVSLISGEPGVGKSTLLAQVLGGFAKKEPKENFLYVSGEENLSQLGKRFKRLNVENPNLYILNTCDLETIKGYMETSKPKVVILDSVQVLTTTGASYSPGSISLVKLVTEEIVNWAKTKKATFILIGQKTKDGSLAGPKHLEHMVDTVLSFENGKNDEIKVLRVTKNRFGHTNNVGFLRMRDRGFSKQVYRKKKIFDCYEVGKTYGVMLKAKRCEFVEVEALVSDSFQGSPRRISMGVESNRLSMLSAIIEKYLGISLHQKDIYIKVSGETRICSQELDTTIILAILSSYFEKPLHSKVLTVGEVSLTGKMLPVYMDQDVFKQIEDTGFTALFCHSTEENTDTEIKLTQTEAVLELKSLVA